MVAWVWYPTQRTFGPHHDLIELVRPSGKWILAGFIANGCSADPLCIFLMVILIANIHATSWLACVLWTTVAWPAASGYQSHVLLQACVFACSFMLPLVVTGPGRAGLALKRLSVAAHTV